MSTNSLSVMRFVCNVDRCQSSRSSSLTETYGDSPPRDNLSAATMCYVQDEAT